eukprot:2406075-Amphidinium_carterae.1
MQPMLQWPPATHTKKAWEGGPPYSHDDRMAAHTTSVVSGSVSKPFVSSKLSSLLPLNSHKHS